MSSITSSSSSSLDTLIDTPWQCIRNQLLLPRCVHNLELTPELPLLDPSKPGVLNVRQGLVTQNSDQQAVERRVIFLSLVAELSTSKHQLPTFPALSLGRGTSSAGGSIPSLACCSQGLKLLQGKKPKWCCCHLPHFHAKSTSCRVTLVALAVLVELANGGHSIFQVLNFLKLSALSTASDSGNCWGTSHLPSPNKNLFAQHCA